MYKIQWFSVKHFSALLRNNLYANFSTTAIIDLCVKPEKFNLAYDLPSEIDIIKDLASKNGNIQKDWTQVAKRCKIDAKIDLDLIKKKVLIRRKRQEFG